MSRLPRDLLAIGGGGTVEFASEWNKIPAELRRLGWQHLRAESPIELHATVDGMTIRLACFEMRRWAKLTTACIGGGSSAVSVSLADWDGTNWVADGDAQPLAYPLFTKGYFFANDLCEIRYNDTTDRWYIVSPGRPIVMGRLASTLARDGTATVTEYYAGSAGGLGAVTGRTFPIIEIGKLAADSSPLDIGVKVDAMPLDDGGAGVLAMTAYDCDLEV